MDLLVQDLLVPSPMKLYPLSRALLQLTVVSHSPVDECDTLTGPGDVPSDVPSDATSKYHKWPGGMMLFRVAIGSVVSPPQPPPQRSAEQAR